MAAAVGCSSASRSWVHHFSRKNSNKKGSSSFRVSCILSSAALNDSYKTLKIRPGASESEVKKAFRQLALQHHPDVCKGSESGVQFHQINEAYDIVMSNLRGDVEMEIYDSGIEDEAMNMNGVNDQDWDLWEEWMGWEGAGIRDYSSHINPYI